MRKLALLLLLALPLAAQTLPPNVEKVETYRGVAQYRLKSNDMTIVLVENHTSPVITFEVVYHVGSRNEAPGNTGSAHLLEHMIFNKSTANYGRANGHKTFQEVLYEAGADFGSTNMTTWNDRMTGYSTLPADKLELAMKVEADRLGRGLILDSERQSEMSVVRNEYEIGENNPSNALGKAVVSASVLVGDFDPSKALAVFDREFGGFKKSATPIPQVITVEPPQEGERRVTVSRPGTLGIVLIGYIRPGGLHPDFIPIDVLSEVLADGVNARLYQSLVDKGLATNVSADNYTFRDPYPLLIEATVAQGKTQWRRRSRRRSRSWCRTASPTRS
jgi:zinc protease